MMAQPDLCTRVDTSTISIKYADFAGRLVAPYCRGWGFLRRQPGVTATGPSAPARPLRKSYRHPPYIYVS